MVLLALYQFDFCYGTTMLTAAEIFLEIKNISLGTGHIQLFGKYKLFHGEGFVDFVKVENKILI